MNDLFTFTKMEGLYPTMGDVITDKWSLLLGECVERMRGLSDNSIDSVVTDPPYHLTSIVKRFGKRDSAPAKYFYCPKASKADRGTGNTHPTVKPNELMRYLCRLVTPPGGRVLDPFMGSGSTGKAALQEGFKFTGIDMTEEYYNIALARIMDVDCTSLE